MSHDRAIVAAPLIAVSLFAAIAVCAWLAVLWPPVLVVYALGIGFAVLTGAAYESLTDDGSGW